MKWITAHNLQEWSSTNAARTTFPALIDALITASVDSIADIRFPNGEKGQVRGPDGVLQIRGAHNIVPQGDSIWEFGTGIEISAKADEDFEKRTLEVDDAVRLQTTFVFATPRTWDRPSKQIPEWLKEKRALGKWKDVKCLDGVAIEHWLDEHPAVAAHFARHELRLSPTTGACSIEEFWNEFSDRFAPRLNEQVLLAGREAQAEDFLRRLAAGNSRLAFAAETPDEVIAFAIASIRQASPETSAYFSARTLVVESVDAARYLATKRGLVFLPRGQARELVGTLQHAGPTIISAGADERRFQHDVLAKPSNAELAKAFCSMGISESEGYDLARKCGRSLAILKRLRPSGIPEQPEWRASSQDLIPALLAGAWKPSVDADKEVLRALGGKTAYEEVEGPLRGLTKLKDAPVDRIDDVWAMRSTVDAFLHLGNLIGPEHLSRFAEQARVVFAGLAEPPPKADEPFRFSYSQSDKHSRWLREGLMTTLLHMAALHREAEFTVAGSSPQRFVDDLVRSLPSLASDHRLLGALRDELPLLAEAAPVPFFEALERLLEGDSAKIKPIFSDRDDSFGLSGGDAHTGVLWALELLAWNEEHLLRSATCLARLAAIDPGGRLANRPLNSLRDVLIPWAPHTNAGHKKRIAVLSHLVRAVPSIAWPLLMSLLPRYHDTVSSTYKPRFGEALPGGGEALTYGIVWATETAVIRLAVEQAHLVAERWLPLIGVLGQLRPESFDLVVSGIEAHLDGCGAEQRFATWDALRKEINRNRAFGSLDWAMRDERVGRLDALVARFQPSDPVLVSSWLFDDWLPNVAGRRDADPMAAVLAERLKAAKAILASEGVSGLLRLAVKVKLPLQMAEALGLLSLSEEDSASLVRQLLARQGESRTLAVVLFSQSYTSFGASWMQQVYRLRAELNLSAEETASLFLSLKDERATWEMVSGFGSAVDDAYWRTKRALGFTGTTEELEFAVGRYLACGRALAAIEATHQRLSQLPSATLLSLLDEAVPEINRTASNGGAMLGYYVEHIFDEIGKRQDVALADVAQAELRYLPFFHAHKPPVTLHRMLINSPEFFVSIICLVFSAENGPAPLLTEQERRLATAGYDLLNGLDVVPGQVDRAVDYDALRLWCLEVRERAAQVDRVAIADSRIGHLLAHAPLDPDDQAWPHRSVRQLLDELSSDTVEDAVRIERFNMRGVHSRAIGEGGQQERALAEQAQGWARAMPEFPRTANMLSALARMWQTEGEVADATAAKELLRW